MMTASGEGHVKCLRVAAAAAADTVAATEGAGGGSRGANWSIPSVVTLPATTMALSESSSLTIALYRCGKNFLSSPCLVLATLPPPPLP